MNRPLAPALSPSEGAEKRKGAAHEPSARSGVSAERRNSQEQ